MVSGGNMLEFLLCIPTYHINYIYIETNQVTIIWFTLGNYHISTLLDIKVVSVIDTDIKSYWMW